MSLSAYCLRAVPSGTFFPIHWTYFCVRRTDGAARIYFFLSLSVPERVTLWSRIFHVHVRERERGKKKEEEEEKSPEKTTSPGRGFKPTDSGSRAEHAIH